MDDAARIVAALRRLTGAFTASGHRFGEQHGLGRTDVTALVLITECSEHGEPIGPTHLARSLGISAASVTVLIDRLVDADILVREHHPSDRRRVLLVPTPRARQAGREHFGALNAEIMNLLAAYPESQLSAAAGMLADVADIVEAQSADLPE